MLRPLAYWLKDFSQPHTHSSLEDEVKIDCDLYTNNTTDYICWHYFII